MTEALPNGHIIVDGTRYVDHRLFEAANQHVLEQGVYNNGLVGVMNEQVRTIQKLQAEIDRLTSEVQRCKRELDECLSTQTALHAAIYETARSM